MLGMCLMPRWLWAQSEHAANVVSNVAVAASFGVQAYDAWRVEDRKRALIMTGARIGTVAGATWLLKTLIHRDRPCAPDNCGLEKPDASMPSGHTAFAFSASGSHFMVTWTLGGLTAGGRVVARKHHITDTLVGAAIGGAAARWIR